MSKKIISIENLKKIISKLKVKRKKIVLCHGVFDLLHVGHINHFQEAKNYGDVLIVSVTSDRYVNKGPNRPAFKEENRLKALAALDAIDYVVLSKNPTGITIIQELKYFFQILKSEQIIPGGVHFELTGEKVTECLGGINNIKDVDLDLRYESTCDPRLNIEQSLEIAFLISEFIKSKEA